jgi:hypothetical protein
MISTSGGGDRPRPAAVEQLKQVGKGVEVPVVEPMMKGMKGKWLRRAMGGM